MGNANSNRILMAHPASPLYGKTSGVGVVRDTTETAHDGMVSVSNGDVAMCLDPALLCEVFEDFIGNNDLPKTGDTVVNSNSPFFTFTAGTPTAAGVSSSADNGQYAMTLAATAEVEVINLNWNDQLNIDTDQEPVFITRLSVDSTLTANEILVFGFASARNTTADSIAQNAWFRIDGANLTLLAESDDNTTDTDDKSTGITLVAGTQYEFKVSCSSLDGASISNIKYFYRTTLGGDWTDITPSGFTFKMLADSAVQPYIQFQKASSTDVGGIKVDYVRCYWKRN